MKGIEIRSKRKQLGLTQKELADKLGVSHNTISNWEKGEVIPNSKDSLIDSFLNINIENVKNENSNNIVNEPPTGYYHPDVSASAGLESEMVNDELKRIPINIPNWEKGVEFINVYGDSMYPKFCSGEIIGIKEVERQYMNYGYAYVIIFNDGQVYLKYIRKGKDDDHWLLASENPKYEAKEYHLSLIKKIFIIKGVITKTTM
ncbi:XRE family transcriptional regulator [uncultured Flavobacterium sp.]|uniref:helix-turn-helix domain-containing protein n=1 Tax=uncultured Flavobacterium sp. TaxID=165435 RepID=UPI0030EEB5B0|tara:strand:- start:3836 stop:4444 length:609 start_codon:yes stop_codon:yes gene_type:complete